MTYDVDRTVFAARPQGRADLREQDLDLLARRARGDDPAAAGAPDAATTPRLPRGRIPLRQPTQDLGDAQTLPGPHGGAPGDGEIRAAEPHTHLREDTDAAPDLSPNTPPTAAPTWPGPAVPAGTARTADLPAVPNPGPRRDADTPLPLGDGLDRISTRLYLLAVRTPGVTRPHMVAAGIPGDAVDPAIAFLTRHGLLRPTGPDTWEAIPPELALSSLAANYEARAAHLRDAVEDLVTSGLLTAQQRWHAPR